MEIQGYARALLGIQEAPSQRSLDTRAELASPVEPGVANPGDPDVLEYSTVHIRLCPVAYFVILDDPNGCWNTRGGLLLR